MTRSKRNTSRNLMTAPTFLYENASRTVIKRPFVEVFGKVVYGIRPIIGDKARNYTHWEVRVNRIDEYTELLVLARKAAFSLALSHDMRVVGVQVLASLSDNDWIIRFHTQLRSK